MLPCEALLPDLNNLRLECDSLCDTFLGFLGDRSDLVHECELIVLALNLNQFHYRAVKYMCDGINDLKDFEESKEKNPKLKEEVKVYHTTVSKGGLKLLPRCKGGQSILPSNR